VSAGRELRVNIVLGYVPSELGDQALARAIDEAQVHDGRLIVVNSSRGDSVIDERFATGGGLAALVNTLDESGVKYELRQPVRGYNPAEEVIAVADEVEADLVVIGLRRRSAVGKLIMGSTAQRILISSPCTVLAVKEGQ
jgi:nucleotide-binding universal stress UspA family protein